MAHIRRISAGWSGYPNTVGSGPMTAQEIHGVRDKAEGRSVPYILFCYRR